jgi:hypothetical protein
MNIHLPTANKCSGNGTVKRCLSGLLLLCACYPVMSLDKVYPEPAEGRLPKGALAELAHAKITLKGAATSDYKM